MMMNRPLFKRVFSQVLCCAGLVIVCGATALAQVQAPAAADAAAPAQATTDAAVPAQEAAAPAQADQQRPDGQIEMDVVHALDASPDLKNDLITAATIQGEVTLSGTVASKGSRDQAESIAGQVAGVTKVNNNLKIGNPQDANPGNPVGQPVAENQPDNGPQANQQQGPPPDQGEAPYAPVPPPAGYADQQPQDQQPQYGGQRPQAPTYAVATGPVTIGPGTLIQLRTSEPVTSKRARDGQPVQFTVIQDVAVGNMLAIPRGATVHGVVTEAKNVGAGDLGGSSVLGLTLTSLDLGGQSYPLQTDRFKVKGPSKTGHTVGNAIGGGIMGTIIGCAVGRGFGCAVGAGAGIAAGTAASAASPGPGIWIPAESRVNFRLTAPLTVAPVNPQEAARLAQAIYPGGPNLYRRGYYPYGRPYYRRPYYGRPYYGYPYGYPPPPVYYHPY